MTQKQLDLIRRGIALTIEQSSRSFRRVSGFGLVVLGSAFVGSVVGLDLWPDSPRWLVYVLAVALVGYALFHSAVVRTFEEAERRAWRDFLTYLPPNESSPVPQAAKSAKPVLRVFRADEEERPE